MFLTVLLALLAVQPVIADPARMAALDRSFVCPENLQSDAARVEALSKFDADIAKAVKNVTLDQIGEARMYLLKKHQCYVTLQNLKQNGVR